MAEYQDDDALETTRVERVSQDELPTRRNAPPGKDVSGVTFHELTRTEDVDTQEDAPLSEPPALLEGTTVDHYRVMRLLGRGGMGEVYLARDTRLGRKIALKIVLERALRGQREKDRFLFEARATAALNHPHIVTIFDTGAHEGRPYVALEYLEGQNLRERLAERELSLPEKLRIARAIAEALAHAHDNGILHRDLKPANVVIAFDGRLRVVDFGLAKVLTDDTTEDDPSFIPGLTQLQESHDDTWTAGTPSYMAPEQWHGESGGAATDVWALGVILFQLCTGRKPFEGVNTMMLAAVVCSKEPSPVVDADVPRELVQLVARCLLKDATQRPRAEEVAEVLGRLLEAETSGPQLDQEPFRGLLPFGEDQAGSFFGREVEIAAFVERVRVQPLLPVVGPSGAGKSSFVRAGVLPRLREQDSWRILDVRPQGRPFRALAAALLEAERAGSAELDSVAPRGIDAAADLLRKEPAQLFLRLRTLAENTESKVLLFVDQLEEVFTLAPADDARRFLEGLYAAADDAVEPIRVAFTVRQDFLDRLATEAGMSAALGHLIVIQRPRREALERIVRRPIEMRGYTFEDPAMVDEMVDAVADSPACLPLLSFAARRLWQERDRDRQRILRATYDEMGGVGGALATHADGVLSGFSRKERRVARELLLRLVTAQRTRKVISTSAALDGLSERGRHVLDRLTEARLVTRLGGEDAAESTIELAHESLIETWYTLTRWVDESRDDLAFLEEVSQAAELWDKRGRLPDELWRGDALAEATRATDRLTSKVPGLVREFLERGRQQHRRRRVQRRVLVALAFIALAGVTVVLALQKQEADRQRALAEARREQSESERAQSLREGARAAVSQERWLEARAKLRSALEIEDAYGARALWLQLSREPLRWRAPLATTAYAVAYAPDGRHVAAACQDGAVYVVDADDRSTRLLRGHDDQVFSVAYGPQGRLASGSFAGEIRVWDLPTGRAERVIDAHEAAIWAVAFSADGKLLASAGGDRKVRLWDVASGESRGALLGHEADVFGVAFDPKGRTIATGSFDGTVRLWDHQGRSLHVMKAHQGRVFSVAYSPDGRLVASAGRDGTARLWSTADGKLVRTIEQGSGLFGVAFSPDGERLATSHRDGGVRQWRVSDGAALGALGRHGAVALAVAYSPDGRRLLSGGDDRSLRQWDPSLTGAEAGIGPHHEGVNQVRFSPDGGLIASAGHDDTVRLWDPETGAPLRVLSSHRDTVRAVAFSPDGKRLVSGGHDNDLRVWRVDTGDVERVLAGHRGAVFGVDFGADGRIVSSGRDRTLRMWDAATGTEQWRAEGHEDDVRDVALSDDGNWVVTASNDSTVRLWRADDGRLEAVWRGHTGPVEGVDFSPDGKLVISGSRDGDIRLWHREDGTSRVVGHHEGRIYWVRFHPDGKRVAAPTSDGTIHLWSLEGEETVFRGHRNEVNGVAFSPDGETAASGSDDGTVRTWRVEAGRPAWRAPVVTGKPLRAFVHTGWVTLDGQSATAPASWSKALTEAVENRATEAVGESVICLRDGDRLEVWKPDGAQPIASQTVEHLSSLTPLADGCAALGSDIWRASSAGIARLDLADPVALGAHQEGFVVATTSKVVVFDGTGTSVAEQAASPGIAAIAGVGEAIVVGYRDGHIARLGAQSPLPFDDTPNAVPTAIAGGPGDSVIVGYGNGTVAMWPLAGGSRLLGGRLHGSVQHLEVVAHRMMALSDLGGRLSWNLEAFYRPECELLARVWQQVPVVWEGGRAVARPPPAEHHCAVASP